MCNSKEIKIGCYVRWNKRALESEILWSAKSIDSVRVSRIEINTGGYFIGERTIHFETPIEKNEIREILSVFECWLEHCCSFDASRDGRNNRSDASGIDAPPTQSGPTGKNICNV